MRFSTIVSVVTLVWGISPRQPSGKNIIRWLLKKRTNGSVRYCQYTSAFLSSLGWAEDEDLQNKLLVDEIGFTYTETGVTEEGEPVCIRNDGYFVNIRILDDLFDVSVFSDYVVELETPLREWS
ncbi:hypothetical protein HmCmsJML108_04145 [Escherichia coli]|uniref:Uncharacterized protein n=6 Tax=Escherichia coli TaxID=562 RepID=B7MTS8_ECO81|nr:hypothetical protein HmCmsJML108_04145 [Escherichia coli]CAR07492.1 conserved hypothetical protein [Escherichia coli ED1a]